MENLATWYRKASILILIVILNPLISLKLEAQQPEILSIQKAYELGRDNYPLIKQRNLIIKSQEYSVSNAGKGYLPVFSVQGQASYQSDVINFSDIIDFPGLEFPEFSKDQYRVYGELNQVLYDGGFIRNQKKISKASGEVQLQNLEVQLYGLYDRINQLFFGALMMDEQLKQNDLLQQDIQNGIEKANALVANGVAFRSSVDELSAQLLQAQQGSVEITATKKAFLEMLSLFINVELDESAVLEKPHVPNLIDDNNRPELLAFDYQKKVYDLKGKMLNAQLQPQIGLFLQGGYGRPGLNFLSDDFEWYYIGGVRLSWSIGSLYTLKSDRQLLDLNKSSVDVQKETFLLNTKISQRQQDANLEKYGSLIQKDDEIIELRKRVKEAAYSQLENGVLSSHEYINQVNAEDRARKSKILHEIQLLQAQYSYQNITGNTINK